MYAMVMQLELGPEFVAEAEVGRAIRVDPNAEAIRRIQKGDQEFKKAVGNTALGSGIASADQLGDAPEWQALALCSQTDPDTFFPEKGGSTREAKRICGHCDV